MRAMEAAIRAGSIGSLPTRGASPSRGLLPGDPLVAWIEQAYQHEETCCHGPAL
jgi:hypothetical protein